MRYCGVLLYMGSKLFICFILFRSQNSYISAGSLFMKVDTNVGPLTMEVWFVGLLDMLFVAGNATYKPLCPSVGASVRRSVTLYFKSSNSLLRPCPCHYCPCPIHQCPCPTHYCPCPTARDRGCRVYGLLFLNRF